MSLAEKVREYRMLKGMSQKQLGEAAHVSGSTISQIEKGKNTKPNIAIVRALATALGTTTVALLGDQPADDIRRLCPFLALRRGANSDPTCIGAMCAMWVRIKAPGREPADGCAIPLLVLALLRTGGPETGPSLTVSEREELETLRETKGTMDRIGELLEGAGSGGDAQEGGEGHPEVSGVSAG